MKKLLKSMVAYGALAFTASLQAQTTVSLQFQGGNAIDPNTAGVDSVSNWNAVNVGGPAGATTFSNSNLIDSTGATTGVGDSLTSAGGFTFGTNSSFATPGDSALYSGFALGNFGAVGDLNLTVSGLNAGDTYELITYVGSGSSGEVLSGTVNSTTYFLQAATLGAYTAGTATSEGAAANGNYFDFTGLTGSTSLSFTLSTSAPPYEFSGPVTFTGLSGFQLIDTGSVAVPEPSTYLLMGLGLLGLVVARNRTKVRV